VIYVKFLSRIIKRIEAKGFEVTFMPKQFEGATMAILTDPNGIQIRLIELTDAAANASRSKSKVRFAKLVVCTSGLLHNPNL
jgi:hypothetical protein